MWDKLNKDKFTTFRYPRKDKDWESGEKVQVYFKNRTPERNKLGIAEIVSKQPKLINDITEEEAVEDGFNNSFEMWLFLKEPSSETLINKLTLKWIER